MSVSQTSLDATIRRFLGDQTVNVGDLERLGSLALGGAAVLYGLRRAPALAALLLGGALLYRGLSGHCNVYQALGISSAAGQRETAPGALPSGERDPLLGPTDDPVDLASDDSFPASDPPAFNSFS